MFLLQTKRKKLKKNQKQSTNQHENKNPGVSIEGQKRSDKEKAQRKTMNAQLGLETRENGNRHIQKEEGCSKVALREWQPTTKERDPNGRVGHSK